MMGVRFDTRDIDEGFRDVIGRSKQLGDVFRALQRPMREDQADHADKEVGPNGPWPARSPATTKKHRSRGKMFAQAARGRKNKGQFTVFKSRSTLGVLPDLIQVKAEGFTVSAVSPVAWAPAHADGDTVGRGSVLPSRPFIWVSQELADTAANAILEYIGDGWAGKPRKVRIK